MIIWMLKKMDKNIKVVIVSILNSSNENMVLHNEHMQHIREIEFIIIIIIILEVLVFECRALLLLGKHSTA
jgi:hypothetical protein